jgi:hypothetical protein
MRGAAIVVAFVALAIPAAAAGDVAPQWGKPELVARVPLDGAWFASQIAVADFNGDGHEDALVTRNSQTADKSFPVTVLLGDGTGRFSDATTTVFDGSVPRDQFARQLVVSDFNGDGRPDVFIADHGDDHDPFPGFQNTLILSAPGGRLVDATANLPQVSDYSHSAAAGDVNGDGATDIYVGNIGAVASKVPPRILLNDGTGHFTVGDGLLPPEMTDTANTRYTGSTFADVNGDGKPDLVLAADEVTPQSAVLLNDGTGHFTYRPGALPAKPFDDHAIGLGPRSLDLNGDGRSDVLMGYTKSNPFYSGRWIQVLIGNGDGTFRDETASRLPQSDNGDAWPEFFQVRDLNGDGRLDFGVETNGYPASTAPLLYLVSPGGAFEPGPAFTESEQGWAFTDAEGNGANDIIAMSAGGDVSLFRDLARNPPPPAPLPPAAPAKDTTPPVLSGLALRPVAFRVVRSRTRPRARLGTTIFYTASEPVTATFTIERISPGVRRAGRCVKPRPRRRDGRRCSRVVPMAGSFCNVNAGGGPRQFHYDGRLRGTFLRPGAYRLRAVGKDAAENLSGAVLARFRVLPR